MKNFIFSVTLGFAILCSVQPASALFGGSGSKNPICNQGCNRVTCQIKEIQDMCITKCGDGDSSIQNCQKQTSKSVADVGNSALTNACKVVFNRVTCQDKGVKNLATTICPSETVVNCKAATAS